MQLICFSHLRWNFVYQRPQHLLSRFAKRYTTYYVEEHVGTDEEDGYSLENTREGVIVIIPHLNNNNSGDPDSRIQSVLITLFMDRQIDNFIFWYYTPMAVSYTRYFKPELIIYDCMDELSAFKFAPPQLTELEQQLLKIADVVFTGGNSLYQAKKEAHANVHACPSSIDKEHFQIARYLVYEPSDQQGIPQPRLGFFGVIDERFDIELIKLSAQARPTWQFIFIGPIIKIDPDILPKAENIHYLGSKPYNELPSYLGGWDIALLPFAINESTRYISPTKTPEYLAAGKPVISTPIADVIEPYGTLGLVHIINDAAELVEKAEQELNIWDRSLWLAKVDKYLGSMSWDFTWSKMLRIINDALYNKSVTKYQVGV
jgi:glycosyltransferase involved in cell wall biosynthesis